MPTWREIERFCKRDGWKLVKGKKKHNHYRKVMPDGHVKHTWVSRGTGEVKGHMWKEILNNQLEVTEDYFNSKK